MVISTGDVRCLFDVLGGDLFAKGTQQCIRLQRLTVANQGGHFVALRTPCFPPNTFDDVEVIIFSHFGD